MNWRVYDSNTVACKVAKEELPGFCRKRITVGPGEAVVVIRNGAVDRVIRESRETVAGVFDKLASWFGGGDDLQLVYVSTSPFDVTLLAGETGASGASGSTVAAGRADGGFELQSNWQAADLSLTLLTADRDEVAASIRLQLAVAPEALMPLVRMMGRNSAISRWDVAAMVRTEIMARVLIPKVAAVRSADLRGNREIAKQIESEVREALAPALTGMGLTLHGFSIAWGTTDQERAEIAQRQAKIADELIKFNHQRVLQDMVRENELARTRLQNLQELKKAEASGDNDLKALYLAAEINRDQMVQEHRVDVVRVDAEIRIIEMDLAGREGKLEIEQRREAELLRLEIEERTQKQRLQEAEAHARLVADEDARDMAAFEKIQLAKLARKRQEAEARFNEQQARLDKEMKERETRLKEDLARMGMMERVLAQGLQAGAVNSSVLETMLREATKQGIATTTDDRVKSLYGAEAARNSIDVYKEAEDRERIHQRDMTGLSADLMQAAKQTPGAATVIGMGTPSPATATPGNVNFASAAAPLPRIDDDLRTQLKKLKDLHTEGLIDEDEYKAKKAKLIEQL